MRISVLGLLPGDVPFSNVAELRTLPDCPTLRARLEREVEYYNACANMLTANKALLLAAQAPKVEDEPEDGENDQELQHALLTLGPEATAEVLLAFMNKTTARQDVQGKYSQAKAQARERDSFAAQSHVPATTVM